MAALEDQVVKAIGCKITLRIAQGIKAKEIGDDELPELCQFVLVAVDSIRNSEEMRQFLETLTRRWTMFAGVTGEILPKLPA
jgi:hypothetical protein